jgi:hypothetical protein
MWTQIAGVGLTVLVPGFLFARLVHERGTRGERPSLFEFTFVAAVLGVLVDAVLAQALASAGVFSATTFFGVLGALCAVLLVIGWRRSAPTWPVRPALEDLAVFALFVFVIARYMPASQYLFASADEGIYPNAAVEIAVAGHSTFTDPTYASLSPELQELTHVNYMNAFYSLERDARGECAAHGLHMMPAFLAVLYTLGGREEMMNAPLLFGLLALAATYVLVRRMAGAWAALLVAGALSLNPASIWFARITFAEGMSHMFLLSAFALLATAWAPRAAAGAVPGSAPSESDVIARTRLFAVGLLFGAVSHAKIDYFLLPWALLVIVTLLLWEGRSMRDVRALLAGWGVMFVIAVYYAFTDHLAYYRAQFFNLEMYGSKNAVMYLGGVFTPLILIAVVCALRQRLPELARLVRIRAVTVVGCVLVTLVFAFLYWVEPLRVAWHLALNGLPDHEWSHLLPEWTATFWPHGRAEDLAGWQRALASPAEYHDFKRLLTFRELTASALGLYLTPIGVWAGLLGAFVLLLRRGATPFVPFVLFFLAQSAFILLVSGQLDCGSAHHHAPGRRFINITIPGLVVFSLAPWFLVAREWRLGRYVRDLALVGLVWSASIANERAQPLLDVPLWDTTLDDIDALAAPTTPDTVVLALIGDNLGQRYQLALRFVGRVKALVLRYDITPEGIETMIAGLRAQGLRPVLMTSPETPDTPARRRAIELLEPEGHFVHAVTENTITYTRYRLPTYKDFSTWRPPIELYGVSAP